MLSSLFRKEEYRVLLVGLDASGKTSILYKMKLGEIVTTIPTIGFNVETITHAGVDLTMWDVGGCDKIRPLWRHYFQNTQALIMVVDSDDIERMGHPQDAGYNTAAGMLNIMLQEEELRDTVLLVFCNKQNLPGARSPEFIAERLNLRAMRGRVVICRGCSAITGDGLSDGFDQLVHALTEKRKGNISSLGISNVSGGDPPAPPSESLVQPKPPPSEEERMASILEEWLEREDEPDDVFLRKLEDFTLETWDHRTHLRIAWIIINRDGRALGTPKLFHLLQQFIANSPRTQRASSVTRGTTFHETMTFFWIHMVHYAIVATKLPRPEFKMFLLMNPQLANGGLFMKYYSRRLMLHTPEARSSVMLPDILPLPSRIPSDKTVQNVELLASAASNVHLPQISRLSDGKVYTLFQDHVLPAWGHDIKVRMIYIMLNLYGRNKGGVDKILNVLESFEGVHFHITETYFWIQMVTFYMLVLEKHLNMPFLWRYGKLSFVPSEESTRPSTPPTPTLEGQSLAAESASEEATYEVEKTSKTDLLRKPVDFSSNSSALDVLLENILSFEEFSKRAMDDKSISSLGFSSNLINSYYSIRLLDSEACKTSFALPDIAPLPSIVR